MNCPTVRRRLLAQEAPDRPDPQALSHLGACPACRAWHRRLLAVERHLPRLPVPPSAAKDRLLRAVLAPAPVPAVRPEPPIATPRPPGWRPSLRERARQKLALALALAAALLIFAFAFWAWPYRPEAVAPQPDLYAKLQGERDRLLAARSTPRERVRSLAAMANRLRSEAQLLVRTDLERLGTLARFYGELVQTDLLTQASALPAEERQEVLNEVREQLRFTDSELSHQVDEQHLHGRARAHLEAIALASREINKRLGALL